MKLSGKNISATVAAVTVIILLFFNPFGNGKAEAVKLTFAKARKGELQYTISATGTIEPLRKYEIKSRASGNIIRMPVDSGSWVRKGGLICQLDATDEKNLLEKSKAELEVARQKLQKAKADLKRQEELFKNKFVSSATLEDYKLKLATAKAQYISARVNRDNSLRRFRDTYVTSPISGIILDKYVELGQIISSGTSSVSGGTKIAVMADLSKVYIKAYVDETDIAKVKLGLKANIVVDAYSGQKFSGSVIKVEPKAIVEQSVTSFLVTTRIDNSKGLLKPGMNASVNIQVEHLKGVVLIPYTAVQQFGKTSFVFVKKRGKIQARRIKTGKSNITSIVVVRGLKKGEKIVSGGLPKNRSRALIKEYYKNRKHRQKKGRRKRRSGRRMMRRIR